MSERVERPASTMNDISSIVELNVGGVFYSTGLATLLKEPQSTLSKLFSDPNKHKVLRDAKGKVFIDRDGVLFRYILDYLRNQKLVLPENFHEKDRLRQEAEFFHLPNLVKIVNATPSFRSGQVPSLPSMGRAHGEPGPHTSRAGMLVSSVPADSSHSEPGSITALHGNAASSADNAQLCANENRSEGTMNTSPSPSSDAKSVGYITVGYRGTFAFGRDGLADVKFRKLSRIIVCGRVSICREVFKDTLNESRDPDRGETDRYTSRFFLKHSFLEQAFDMLLDEGFQLVASCGSGTNSAGEVKPGLDTEEAKWQHYNEFIFMRR